MMRRHPVTIVLLLVLFVMAGQIFTSCEENPVGYVPPMTAYDSFTPPRVSGIWLTDSIGAKIGFWGKPVGWSNYNPDFRGKLIPDGWQVSVPYPNPSNGAFIIRLTVPDATYIKVSVVKALGPGETWESFRNSTGAIIPAFADNPVLEFSVGFLPGVHLLPFENLIGSNSTLSPGFYRIYFQTDSFSLYTDAFIYSHCNDLPPMMPGMDGACQ